MWRFLLVVIGSVLVAMIPEMVEFVKYRRRYDQFKRK